MCIIVIYDAEVLITVFVRHFSHSSSIGTTTLSWVSACSAGRFYRVPLPAARQTPNLEENQEFRVFELSAEEAPPASEATLANPAAEGGTMG
jgi:hypothetical protein